MKLPKIFALTLGLILAGVVIVDTSNTLSKLASAQAGRAGNSKIMPQQAKPAAVHQVQTGNANARVQMMNNNPETGEQERIYEREQESGEYLEQNVSVRKNTGDQVQGSNSGSQDQRMMPAGMPGSNGKSDDDRGLAGDSMNFGRNGEATPPGLMEGFTTMSQQERQEVIQNRLQNIQQSNDERLQQRATQMLERQQQIQEKVAEATQKLQSRSRWMQLLFGTDIQAVDDLQEQLNNYEDEIASLNDLYEQAETEADQAAIEEALQTLQSERQAIRQDINQQATGLSLFGWVRRLFQ